MNVFSTLEGKAVFVYCGKTAITGGVAQGMGRGMGSPRDARRADLRSSKQDHHD